MAPPAWSQDEQVCRRAFLTLPVGSCLWGWQVQVPGQNPVALLEQLLFQPVTPLPPLALPPPPTSAPSLAGSWLPALSARLVTGGRWSEDRPVALRSPVGGWLNSFLLILTAHCPVRTWGQGEGAVSFSASHNWVL